MLRKYFGGNKWNVFALDLIILSMPSALSTDRQIFPRDLSAMEIEAGFPKTRQDSLELVKVPEESPVAMIWRRHDPPFLPFMTATQSKYIG